MSCLQLDDADIIKVAEPMMDDIMLGVSRRDYALHSRHFSVDLKSRLGPDEFLLACDHQESHWGQPGQRELITIARKQKSFSLVWEQHFNRHEGQVLALTTVALKGGRYFVDFFLLH